MSFTGDIPTPRTYLEFLVMKLLGPPVRGNASLRWRCPLCDRTAKDKKWFPFTVLPPKAGRKVRCYCHRCGFLGDEHDLLRRLHPWLNYEWRKGYLAPFIAEWEQRERELSALGEKVIPRLGGLPPLRRPILSPSAEGKRPAFIQRYKAERARRNGRP